MANYMVTKRDLLKSFLEGVLQNLEPTYTVADRLRKNVLNQGSRNDRVSVMGENYTYAVIKDIPIPTPSGQRSSASTTRKKRHQFMITVWYRYYDDDQYANSSQKQWDDIYASDSGVIMSIENKKLLEDGGGNQYVLSNPQEISEHIEPMDNNPEDYAHFLQFQVDVRGN